MEHQSRSQEIEEYETSDHETDENLTKESGTAAQNQSSNQKTEEIPTSSQTSEDYLTYSVNSETVAHNPSFIAMTTPTALDPELISVCSCLISGGSDIVQETRATERKRRIMSSVLTVETYLREHRISELTRFIFAKIMCNKPRQVQTYISDLLDKCMCFRAGFGKPPVLFEERHLEAVIKSFDPGDRGWLTAGQVRRAFTTLGLTPKSDLEVRTPTSKALNLLRETQERELYCLLIAGCEEDYFC